MEIQWNYTGGTDWKLVKTPVNVSQEEIEFSSLSLCPIFSFGQQKLNAIKQGVCCEHKQAQKPMLKDAGPLNK